jgi:ribosomal protein L28
MVMNVKAKKIYIKANDIAQLFKHVSVRRSIYFNLFRSIRPIGINIFKKILKSEVLGVNLRLYISSKAFKTIKKYGK